MQNPIQKSKLSSILLSLLLCGCAAPQTKIVYETKLEKVYPSEALLVPCTRYVEIDEVLVSDIYTNRDGYAESEAKCSARVDKFINWYKEARSSDGK